MMEEINRILTEEVPFWKLCSHHCRDWMGNLGLEDHIASNGLQYSLYLSIAIPYEEVELKDLAEAAWKPLLLPLLSILGTSAWFFSSTATT
jgi:hypothetical protein